MGDQSSPSRSRSYAAVAGFSPMENRQGFGSGGRGGGFARGFHSGFGGDNMQQGGVGGRGRGRGRGRFGSNNSRHELSHGNNGRWYVNVGGGQGWNGGFGQNARPTGFNSGLGFSSGSFGRPAGEHFGMPSLGGFAGPIGGMAPSVVPFVPPAGAFVPPDGVQTGGFAPGGAHQGGVGPALGVGGHGAAATSGPAPVVPSAGVMPGGQFGKSVGPVFSSAMIPTVGGSLASGLAGSAANTSGSVSRSAALVVADNSTAVGAEHVQQGLLVGAADTEKGKSKADSKGLGKPYCYRCLTKGHTLQECSSKFYCEICESVDHIATRCPIFRSAVKPTAQLCGYGGDGLGFFHIPLPAGQRIRHEPRAALVKITNGQMTVNAVISELERLIPGKWKWVVHDNGDNTFRTIFPSAAELKRMVEWGKVHTKVGEVEMEIIETGVGNEVKYVIPKVWVQCKGLPSKLREYLIIWAVGSILGITKAVDMLFTRRYEIARLQVLVLDSSLIPDAVDVAIGDHLYEVGLGILFLWIWIILGMVMGRGMLMGEMRRIWEKNLCRVSLM